MMQHGRDIIWVHTPMQSEEALAVAARRLSRLLRQYESPYALAKVSEVIHLPKQRVVRKAHLILPYLMRDQLPVYVFVVNLN